MAGDPNTIAYVKNMVDVSKGVQRTNRYQVQFQNPPVPLPQTPFEALTVVLPQEVMDAVADGQSGWGQGRVVPKGAAFNNGVALVFPTFNNWAVQDFLYRWTKALYFQEPNGTFTTQYYHDVVRPATMTVTTFTPNGQPTRTLLFTEVYPIEKQSTTGLAMQSGTNPVLMFMYTFNFREWKEIPNAIE